MHSHATLFAIIRETVPGSNSLKAGLRVKVAADALFNKSRPGALCVCYFDEAPGSFFAIAGSNLLDCRYYLRNSMSSKFWCLAAKNRLLVDKPDKFLSDAREFTFGNIPFRFESEGELIYYLYEKELDTDEYYRMQADFWPSTLQYYFRSSRAWRKPPGD